MATAITNLSVVELAQNAINSMQGFQDSIKPFSVIFDGSVFYGNGVSVPLITAGAASSSLDFTTDDNNAIGFSSVLVNTVAKSQINVPGYQYAQIERYSNTFIPAIVNRVLKSLTDTAYGVFNTTNWPIASNKVIVSTWSESAPTLVALYTAIEKAKATQKLDPSNIVVLMPSTTYAGIKGVLDALPRDNFQLGFTVVPVYNTAITQTCITDGSAVAIGIGADVGIGYEEFEFLTDAKNQIGYGFHVIPNPSGSYWTIGSRVLFGTKVINTTGFLWISAS